jgi:glycosyltransferase involved in cell wall biosynthesis
LVTIDALAQLRENCVLVLLGDAQGRDGYLAEIKAKANALGLEDRIIIPGHSRDMPAALAASDMVVSASTDPEAFGRVAIEAQAMQTPVIATAHGGALETVADGQTGFLVSPSDAKALADGIRKALSWKDYNGDAARARITANFSTESLQRKTLKIYRAIYNDLLK